MLGFGDEDSHFVASWWLNEVKVVSAWRQVFELAIEEEDLLRLRAIARSRTEPASRVVRAQMLLAYRDNSSCFAVGRALGVHHQTVQRCVERAVAYGPQATCLGPAKTARSRPRRGLGWWIWPVGKPRSWATHTSFGRRDCWPATHASTGRRQGMIAWPSLPREPCAKSSVDKP